MLNRIVVINSTLYAKANLLLGDAESIQLAAENNVGKSSLINCLNFLYILDKREWKFGDNTPTETIRHYFKTIDQSYVVFEIVKDGHYCIVVKRSADKVKRVGNSRSNSFTKMYKHLIKADAINEEAFKDALSARASLSIPSPISGKSPSTPATTAICCANLTSSTTWNATRCGAPQLPARRASR